MTSFTKLIVYAVFIVDIDQQKPALYTLSKQVAHQLAESYSQFKVSEIEATESEWLHMINGGSKKW